MNPDMIKEPVDIAIDQARIQDAQQLLHFLKQIGSESDNLTFGEEGIPVTLKEEEDYLAAAYDSRDCLLLLAKHHGKIAGNANLTRLPRRMKHRGELSISIARDYWNQGIGTMLLTKIIAFAKEHDFEFIDLEVRSDHHAAIHLYQKFGFQKTGIRPAFFKINGHYFDCDMMTLQL